MSTAAALPARPTFTVPVLLALFALYVIWGSTYLGIAIAIDGIPPLLMAGSRFIIAGALMLTWQRWRGAPWPTARQWGNAAVIGALLLGGGNGGVTIAEQWVASGLAAVMIATVPLFSLLFAMLYGQRPRALEWIGIALGFSGIVLLNADARLSGQPLGAALLLFAAASWAFGSVWSRRIDLPEGPMASAAEMLCGGLLMLVLGGLRGERVTSMPPTHALMAVGYLVLFGSLIAFSAYQYLLKTVRPALATSYAYANPVVAVLLGTVFLHEEITGRMVMAMVVILGAVGVVALGQLKKAD